MKRAHWDYEIKLCKYNKRIKYSLENPELLLVLHSECDALEK